ncbi:hypothetical protein, partial [Peribacillus butanolivorans]
TPQAQRRRGGSRTARGKRVPGVEINVRIFKTLKKTVDKLDFHRVCLQSEPIPLESAFSVKQPFYFLELA